MWYLFLLPIIMMVSSQGNTIGTTTIGNASGTDTTPTTNEDELYYSLDGSFFELKVLPNEDKTMATYTATLGAEAWLGIGFAHPDNNGASQMVNADFPSWAVCGHESGGVLLATPYQLDGFASNQFTELDRGIGVASTSQDGTTTMVFTLPFGDGVDDPLFGGANNLLWAYGPSNNFAQLHPVRGVRAIDFLTSDVPPEPVFTCATDFDCSGSPCVDSVCRCPYDKLAQDCSVPADGTCPEDAPFCIASAIEGEYARVGISMKSTGWISICYDTAALSGMVDADCWVFSINPFTQAIVPLDVWSTAVGVNPTTDVQQDITQASGYHTSDGHFIASFRRKLDTGDTLHDRIIVDDIVWASWAHGPEDAMTLHTASNRGRFEVNLFNGQVIVLGDASKSQNWIPLLAIGLLVIVAATLKFIPGSNQHVWWYQRIGAPVAPTTFHKLTLDFIPQLYDLTYAEALVVFGYIITLLTFFFVSLKNQTEAQRSDVFTYGHLCQMHLALLFLPIVRNSIWLHIVGVSFERGVKFHRWLGRLFIFFLVIHFVTMLVDPNHIDWESSNLFATTNTVEGQGVAYGFMALLVFLTMGMFTFEWFRRNQFEVFFYTHLLFPIGLMFAILHNTDMWYWLAFPLGLYIIDRIIRFARSHRAFETIRAEVLGTDSRITKLMLKQSGFKFEGGDYAFLQVPQVSFDQWHPFSISNAPNDEGLVGFHILDSGKGTFTGRLANLVASGVEPVVYVDGPHGKPTVDVTQYSTVVLVAGGVGITPLMSTLGEIAQARKQGKINSLNFKVHLIWSNKYRYPFNAWFNNFLASETVRVLQNEGVLEFHFYATRAKKTEYIGDGDGSGIRKIPTELRTKAQMGQTLQIDVKTGRPNIADIMQESVGGSMGSACCMACGPARLVADVQRLSQDMGIHFHKETFAL